ncbi:HNH endonuclease [uncultured Thiodictyon sp.]|uniref:HNH endonuclease n=1 Tax=uncultured Thiodictyon sp. TaxID=1846217 RepID=UPI0025EA7CDB|nr:HNH endonuclease [uncultured Thiodictyon sp.]
MADGIPKALRERIADAAQQRCGYCLTDQRVSGAQMHVEHIVPRARGGSSQESNLWLACAWCNSYKGIQVEAQDPETGASVTLFNPRRQRWIEHFLWSQDGTYIRGVTATGRATVVALNLNNPYIVPARRLWALAGWHPPK